MPSSFVFIIIMPSAASTSRPEPTSNDNSFIPLDDLRDDIGFRAVYFCCWDPNKLGLIELCPKTLAKFDPDLHPLYSSFRPYQDTSQVVSVEMLSTFAMIVCGLRMISGRPTNASSVYQSATAVSE